MNKRRPVNLDLRTIKQPVTAIVSILHRISGFITFLFVPLVLWALAVSLRDVAGFQAVGQFFAHPVAKFFLWGFLVALVYHLIAGIRHLLMDLGIGDHLPAARYAAWAVISISVIFAVGLGVWLW